MEALEHIKTLRGLRRTAAEMAKDDPDAWRPYAEALDAAVQVMEKANSGVYSGDAVTVVRCRECAVPHNEMTGCPLLLGIRVDPDFYCKFGYCERREDGM